MFRYICLLLALIATQSAFANPWKTPPLEPWYIGAGIGMSFQGYNQPRLAHSFNAATTTSSYNHDDLAVNILGGFQFNELLALEIGFSQLGNAVATSNGQEAKLFNINSLYSNIVFRQRYNPNAFLYAKAGGHHWDIGLDDGTSNHIRDGSVTGHRC
jgi:hypothetical protein